MITHTQNNRKGKTIMNTEIRPNIRMKGMPVAIVKTGHILTIWVASPTGDSSDSHLFTMPCVNEAQAEVIMETWQKVWGLV
jgi:molybdopterin-guanine dinucleotide biosynthesis protein